MSNQPFGSALRGAVDLSALRRPGGTGAGRGSARPAGSAGSSGASSGPGGGDQSGRAPSAATGSVTEGYVVHADEASFQQLVSASVRYPVVMLLWSPRQQQSVQLSDQVAAVVRSYEGRLQLALINVDTNPALVQAFVQGQLPMCVAFLQGQPVPLFGDPQTDETLRQLFDQLVQVAIQSGVTGRVPAGPDDAAALPEEPAELPETLQRAYDAIDAGDYKAAAAAFHQALADNPGDEEARVGLAQVDLLRRTDGVDAQSVRAQAAAAPGNVTAQLAVADLDILGGHVDDAFRRLIDTVRITSGDERTQVRDRLIDLFGVVGTSDPRVIAARKALTAALF